MNDRKRIVIDPGIRSGKPYLRGTRITGGSKGCWYPQARRGRPNAGTAPVLGRIPSSIPEG